MDYLCWWFTAHPGIHPDRFQHGDSLLARLFRRCLPDQPPDPGAESAVVSRLSAAEDAFRLAVRIQVVAEVGSHGRTPQLASACFTSS